MSAEVEVARGWVRKALRDLLNADNNLAALQVPFDTVCFHCQKAAEKTRSGSRWLLRTHRFLRARREAVPAPA